MTSLYMQIGRNSVIKLYNTYSCNDFCIRTGKNTPFLCTCIFICLLMTHVVWWEFYICLVIRKNTSKKDRYKVLLKFDTTCWIGKLFIPISITKSNYFCYCDKFQIVTRYGWSLNIKDFMYDTHSMGLFYYTL
jgi:hypothetical protein